MHGLTPEQKEQQLSAVRPKRTRDREIPDIDCFMRESLSGSAWVMDIGDALLCISGALFRAFPPVGCDAHLSDDR
jgi:hypothetical protein